MNQILLSTTGNISSITINDLAASKFTHPITELILCDSTDSTNYPFTISEVKNSTDLQTALTAGYITLTDELSNPVTDVYNSATQGDFNSISPITTLGDIIYGSGTNLNERLAGNTTVTKKFLRQTGNGTISAIPAWDTVTKSDVGLSSVENTALSTWAGTSNITTIGTISSGTWSGSTIAINKGGTNSTTALNNGRVMISTGGAIVENSALTSSALVLGGTSLGSLALGTSNQVLGMNNAGTANEYKTISVGTTGTDFSLDLATANSIVLNLPDASTTNRGVITNGTQTIAGTKTFSNGIIYNQNIVKNGIISPLITASQNNYNPTGLSTCNVIRLSLNGNYALTGLVAQESGREIILINLSASTLSLTSESASSTAANRFASPTTSIGTLESVILWYDITLARWHVIANSTRQN